MKQSLFICILIFSNILSQDVIGEELYGQDLIDYLVDNYKTNNTLGYNNARDIMYEYIDIHGNNQLPCIYSGYTIVLDCFPDKYSSLSGCKRSKKEGDLSIIKKEIVKRVKNKK